MLYTYATRAHTVSPVIFPVSIGLLIWLPDEPNLFNGNVYTYRSYPLIQRNIYSLFINVKKLDY